MRPKKIQIMHEVIKDKVGAVDLEFPTLVLESTDF